MAKAKGAGMFLFVQKTDLPQLYSLEITRAASGGDDVKPMAQTLLVYLNCAYYTLQSPFRVDCNGKRIVCVSNPYFRMLYAGIAITAQCFLAYEQIILCSPVFSWMADSSSQGQMKVTLDWMINYAWFVFNAAVKWELWFAPGRVEPILKLVSKLEGKLKRPRWQYFGIFQYPVALGTFYYVQMTAFNLWEVETALSNGNGTSAYNNELDGAYLTIRHAVLVVAAIYENQAMQVGTKLVPLISLVFMSLVLSFDHRDYNKEEIKDVSKLINELSLRTKLCFGRTIVVTCFCLLPYDAQNLQHFVESSWDLQFQYSYYILFLFFQLWAAGRVHAKLNDVNQLAIAAKGYNSIVVAQARDTNFKGYQRVRSLWMDAYQHNCLGVRGHCMTLTYSLLGNVAVWMLAYSLTVTQLQAIQNS